MPLSHGWDVDLYLKDESTHRTGSLKHRLARSLFLHALCNGWIGPGTTAVEASSGSTAVSETWFARMLDVPFVAVMPRSTSAEKVALIEREGGRCHLVHDSGSIYADSDDWVKAVGLDLTPCTEVLDTAWGTGARTGPDRLSPLTALHLWEPLTIPRQS